MLDALNGGIGIGLGILALLVALAAAATFLTFGSQRGRVNNLEIARDDGLKREAALRQELEDNERRHTRKEQDLEERLTDALDRSTRQQSTIDTLSGRVDTLSTLPLAQLATALESNTELMRSHAGEAELRHRESMHGQELISALVLDLLNMTGDQRSHLTIAETMRGPDPTPPRTQATPRSATDG